VGVDGLAAVSVVEGTSTMNFAWRECPGCGAMFYGRRDMCLTCRLALESGEAEIVRVDHDEDGDKPAVVRAEDVLRRAEAVAGAASEEEGGEPEVPQAEQAAPALSPWPPPAEELAQVAAGRTVREIADLYGVDEKRARNMLYKHSIPYKRLRTRRRTKTSPATEPSAALLAASINTAVAMDSESASKPNVLSTAVPTSDDGARFAASMRQLIDLAAELRQLGRKHHDRFDLEIIVRL